MKKIYLLFFVIFFILPCSCKKSNEKSAFTIVHMNDTHSKDKELITVSKEDGTTNRYGGAARRKTFIDNVKRENENVIVMHAGDTVTGSVFSIVYKGMDEVELMNDIGVNVAALGNHEFDFGIEQLNNMISNRNFPTIACNVKVKSTDKNYVLPYIITNINGIHVAVIGVLQSEKMNILQGLDHIYIEDEIDSLKNLLDEIPLNTTNDVTILLSHAGFDIDKKIASEIPNVFNIIIGGHTHTLLRSPVIIGNTTIVQAGQYGEYIGTIDVIFRNGKYAYPDYKLIRLDESIKEDETILAKIEEMQRKVDEEFNVEIASLPYTLTDKDVRNKSTALGNFVSDIVSSSQDGIDIALINSGSLRGELPGGKVTLANMYEFFPFDNLIILTTLNGRQLKTILQLSVSKAGEGAFLQVSKDCIINVDSNGKLLESYINGKAINDNDKYVVAVADYIFNGGEKYIDSSGKPLFQYGDNIIHTGLDIRDLIINKLKEYQNVPESVIDNTERIIFN